MRQQRRNAEPDHSDEQLDVAVHPQQRLPRFRVPPVSPRARDKAADAESQHEYGDHEGRRVDRVAEDVSEHTDPDHLIDQAADAGKEEQEIECYWVPHAEYTGLPT